MVSKLQRLLIIFILLLIATQSVAQYRANLRNINRHVDASQKQFSKILDDVPMEKSGEMLLQNFITETTNNLQKSAYNSKNLTPEHKILALDAQANFLDTIAGEIRNKIFDINYTRLYIDGFKQLWESIFTHKPYAEIMKPFNVKVSGLMAAVFKDYPEAQIIKNLAILKTLENIPEKIPAFLTYNDTYSLLDSLIFIYADNRPEQLISFASTTKDEILLQAIKNNPSPLVQSLLSIANQKNAENYIPFAWQLAEQKTTFEDIDKSRAQPSLYYQLLVDAEISNSSKVLAGEVPVYAVPAEAYVKKYAIKFFTDIINSLHEEPSESKRYFVLEGLRPQDLYYIITGGETELYTSSYLYMYKKLMGMFPKNGADSLFRLVKFDQYKKFLMMAGRYNTLSAFMKQMPADSSAGIIKQMMNGLEKNVLNGLEQTITVAETFPGIVNDDYLSDLVITEIKANYSRCINIPDPHGMKIYDVLENIYKAEKNINLNNTDQLNPALKIYYKLQHSSLHAENESINQLVFFYGDEDGKSSYASFLTNFTDASQWAIEKNSSWVTIKSKKGYPVSIYASLPLSDTGGDDDKARDSLVNFLKNQHIICEILIHRGHSYHLATTLRYATPAIRLAILGSCGGYTEIFELLKKSPLSQVISTKQVGSKLVNEPLLRLLNDYMVKEKDLEWAEIWKQLDQQLKGSKQAYDYFQEYVPPYKNIALLVSALFTQSDLE